MARGDSTSSSSRTRRSVEPSAEERALFERAMQGVRPLRRTPKSAPPPQPSPASRARENDDAAPPSDSLSRSRGRVEEGAKLANPGIDKATLAKLTRGEIAIDARLDLHGLTQAEAHRALDRALDSALRQGLRLLLVITGKGVGGDGILRRSLPGWIAAGAQATRVLRIVPAQARHGGGGASYVYLRRRRGSGST